MCTVQQMFLSDALAYQFCREHPIYIVRKSAGLSQIRLPLANTRQPHLFLLARYDRIESPLFQPHLFLLAMFSSLIYHPQTRAEHSLHLFHNACQSVGSARCIIISFWASFHLRLCNLDWDRWHPPCPPGPSFPTGRAFWPRSIGHGRVHLMPPPPPGRR